MKLCLLFVVCFNLGVSALSYSQKSVTLHLKQTSAMELFREIQRQTGYSFIFNPVYSSQIGNISVKVKDSSVEEVLKQILAKTNLEYKIEAGIITIHPSAKNREDVSPRTIIGIVKDEHGQSLPGVTVQIQGTHLGVTTDIDGKFRLDLPVTEPRKMVLVFSFVGMESQQITIEQQEYLEVILKAAVAELEDVVVTGYFNKSKSSFTGSVTQIKREDIQKFGNTGILNILQLIDPSFKIKENNEMGSDPNTLPDFFIRGEGSFMGNSNIPTFIVDGYEVSLQTVFDMDIDRIESLNILKDASATVLYGSRAANGVIVIETRRPETGELTIDYSNRTSLSMADLTDYHLLNAREKLQFEKLAGLYTDKDDPAKQYQLDKEYQAIYADMVRGVNTDWISKPLQNAVSHSHSIYLSGGDRAVTYGLNGNYAKNNGVIKQSSRETYGVSFDLTYRIKDKINIRNSFSYSNTLAKISPYGSFTNYVRANPYSPVYDENGKFIKSYKNHPNYLYNASLAHKDETRNGILTNNLSINYYFTPDLRLKASLALSKNTSNREVYISPEDARYVNKSISEKGRYSIDNGRGFSYNLNTTLSYTLQQHKHLLFSGIGINLIQNEDLNNNYAATGFVDENFNDINFALQYASDQKPTSQQIKDRLIGFLGNANYSFDNRYFLDLSARIDGSSKYGANKRYAFLWSLGGGWNVHKEKFMQQLHVLEELKIRGSIGLTGNQDFDPNMARTMYAFNTKDIYYQSIGASFIQYGNEELKWQKSLKRNIGLDIQTLQRRLTVRFEYYNDRTEGLLLPVTVAPSLGFASYTENFGKQCNQGVEIDLNAVVIRNKYFDWAVSFSGTHNRNKIIRISNALATLNHELNADKENFTKPVSLYEEGESLTVIKAVRSLGINPETGKEQYLTKDGHITEVWNYKDKVRVGDLAPDLEGVIGTNVMWKQFSLNLLFRYSFGGQIYNQTLVDRVEGADPSQNADRRVLDERWQQPGDHSFYKDIADRSRSFASSRFVQNNNYLECSSLSLAYRFDRELIKKWGLRNLKIAFNMNDLFYISTVKRERGLDYPFARQYTFSLNLNF